MDAVRDRPSIQPLALSRRLAFGVTLFGTGMKVGYCVADSSRRTMRDRAE